MNENAAPAEPVPTPDLPELSIDDAPAGYGNEEAFTWLAGVEHGMARVEPELARLRGETAQCHRWRAEDGAHIRHLEAEVVEVRARVRAQRVEYSDHVSQLRRNWSECRSANETAINTIQGLRDERDRTRAALARLVLTVTDSWSPDDKDFDGQVDAAEAAIVGFRDLHDSMGAESWAEMREQRDEARAELESSRSSRGAVNTIPTDAEEQIARRIADYWHDLRAAADEFPKVVPDESDYGVAHHVLGLISSPGWGAVTNPTDGEGELHVAASDLFDNRLGSVDDHVLGAPRSLWADLGELLYGAGDARVRALRAVDHEWINRPLTDGPTVRAALVAELAADQEAACRRAAPVVPATAEDAEAREFAEDMHHQATFVPKLAPAPTEES